MRQNFRRVPIPRPMQAKGQHRTFVSPVRGWVTNENRAASKGGAATILENWFPLQRGVRIRKGSLNVGEIANPVDALFEYNTAPVRKLFAADETKIYDVFAALNEDVTGQTSGDYSTVQFGTAGGEFLYAVNGLDSPQLYDGSSWMAVTGASTPAITGVTTSGLSHVWAYRSRLFFIQRNSLKAWFLPVDSIGGAALDISLAGVFQRGGSLLFGTTWSADAGNGIDDKCVFVSSEGEVAIYSGNDPATALDWRLTGRYDIGKPLGKRSLMNAGGDVLIATEEGIIPLSAVVSQDRAALTLSAVTRNIEPDWMEEARSRVGSWEMLKWPSHNMGIIGLPMDGEEVPYCWVVNLQTGAWAKYTNWDVRSVALYDGDAYFGTADGRIMQAETGAFDDEANYYCDYVGLFDHMGTPGAVKVAKMARGTFRASVPPNAKISVAANYVPTLPEGLATPVVSNPDSEWDTALWDVALWDGGQAKSITTRWVSVGKSGFVLAPSLRVLVSGGTPPDGELVSIEYLYETGGTVV